MEVAMNNYAYIGTYFDHGRKKEIYYDQTLDKFYALPLDYFDKNTSAKRNIQNYEILFNDELKLLRSIQKYNAQKEAQKREEVKRLEQEMAKREEEQKQKLEKRENLINAIKKGVIVVLCCSALISAYVFSKDYVQEKYNDSIDSLESPEEDKIENISAITDAIMVNDTIPNKVKECWLNDFTYLFREDIYIPKSKVNGMVGRLTKGDFSTIDESDYNTILSKVIFNEDSAVAYALTASLDECANNREPGVDSHLLGLLTIKNPKNYLNQVFLYGPDRIVDVLANNYNVSKDKIQELIDLLDKFYYTDESLKDESARELKGKISAILTAYYQDKKLNEYDQFVLASDIYNPQSDKISINNNIFNDSIIVTVSSDKYGPYELYFDRSTNANISASIYQQKIIDLLKEKGSNLDYNDPDCRFLLYLFSLGYRDQKSYEEGYALTNPQTPEELATHLMDSVFDYLDNVQINSGFLYGYLSNGQVNLEDVRAKINGIYPYDEFSISLFVEYIKCLQIEVQNGHLTEEEFQKYYDDVTYTLNRVYPRLAHYIDETIENNGTLLINFSLPINSNQQLDSKVKKYVNED